VPSQLSDAVLGLESRQLRGRANLGPAGDWDHDRGLLLTLGGRLNAETRAAGDDGEDVEEVDCEDRIEESVFPYCTIFKSGNTGRSAIDRVCSAQSPIDRFARNSDRASVGTVIFFTGGLPSPPNSKCRASMPFRSSVAMTPGKVSLNLAR